MARFAPDFLTRRAESGNVGRMTKKRLGLIAVLPLTIAVTLGVLAMLPPGPGVTKANYDRIQTGMSVQDVELLLGGTALPFHGFPHRGSEIFVWQGDDGALAFVEIADSSVISKQWHPSTESMTDKLRRWLHLPK
jgi:hypothetical protein